MKKICAILPSYNEGKNIAGVIKGVLRHKINVVVVDDGSTDDTYRLAEESGVSVIRHAKKQGKGAALKDGLDFAILHGYDYMIAMDADGQHSPEEIPLFISEADKHEDAGIIIGNRLSNPEGMPATRLYTNQLMSQIVSSLCGQYIPDTQCGFKLIKKTALENINIKTRKFEIETELLVKAAKANFRIISVPITTIYAGEKSHINPFMDALRFIKFTIGAIFKR
ncbi:MAG: glycosyltransferase family 2 protein [Candidatus Omnitrophica bacterium]|nr:glycosyltransferase family 2 protein [Candidatus Omnitrophota bacterium]